MPIGFHFYIQESVMRSIGYIDIRYILMTDLSLKSFPIDKGGFQPLTRWPKGAPTTTQLFSRQIKTNNVTTTIICTNIYPAMSPQ